jgi:hypothetical protein
MRGAHFGTLEPHVRSVRARVNYVAQDAGRAVYEILDDSRSQMALREELIEIRDARTLAVGPSLEREGFTLVHAPTSAGDLMDPLVRERTYLPELATTIQRLYGASYVWMQPGSVIRVTDPSERSSRHTPDAARFLHLDYSARSARSFLEQSTGYDPAVAARARRIFAVNTWRCLTPPPQDVPLAVCDKRTSTLEDLVVGDAHYETEDGPTTFEISLVRYNPAHAWWYFSNMSPDELLVFKGWDLGPDPTSCVLHGAFVDPSCPSDAPLRMSLEARGFAVFEE